MAAVIAAQLRSVPSASLALGGLILWPGGVYQQTLQEQRRAPAHRICAALLHFFQEFLVAVESGPRTNGRELPVKRALIGTAGHSGEVPVWHTRSAGTASTRRKGCYRRSTEP